MTSELGVGHAFASKFPVARSMKCIFSVDVEDWFHILDVRSTPGMAEWDSLPSRVESNFQRLLDTFDEMGVRTTCFFLGWIARKYPRLVQEANTRGHEVASHGFAHRLVYEMTPGEFRADAAASKRVIEDLTGRAVTGYRCAGFSVDERTPWFFQELGEAGYEYDSSVFPGRRNHGGWANGRFAPYRLRGASRDLIEFPITLVRLFTRDLCFFGGGYLRLFPPAVIEAMARRVLRENRPVTFYIHPREIDPGHPRLPMSFKRRFASYVNLKTTEAKIKKLLGEFEMTTFRDFIAENPDYFGPVNTSVESAEDLSHAWKLKAGQA